MNDYWGLINYWLLQISIYIGLVAVCGFVLYDTQMIVLKRRHGDTDHIKHAVSSSLVSSSPYISC